MYNSITAAAFLVKDPEVKTTSTGKKVANLRVGISSANAKTKCFIDCEFWDKTAEIAENILPKAGSLSCLESFACLSGRRREKPSVNITLGARTCSSWVPRKRMTPHQVTQLKIVTFRFNGITS